MLLVYYSFPLCSISPLVCCRPANQFINKPIHQQTNSSTNQQTDHEIITQLKTSIPASLSSIVYKIPWLISIAFVGRIGSKELAAGALATSICNVTGLSLGSSLGLSSAVTTLTGQSKGEIQRRRRVLRDRVRKDHLSSSSFDSLTRTMNEENNKRCGVWGMEVQHP